MSWYRGQGKRAFDVLLVIGTAPITAPLLVLLCLAIVAFDRRNPLFCQERLGRDQRPFTLYKLRTLPVETEQRPTHEIDLSGASKLGEILRKTKLDELPQLYNVVRGTMSLVGPRPCLAGQLRLINERAARDVFSVRPGVTGRSQVNGIDMSDPIALAKSDATYVDNISLSTDLYILIDTLRPHV
ncbi:MAG: sugar transferase [Pseudomonadota bacterium]